MKAVVCPVCGLDDTDELFEKQGCRFVRCRGDGLVYINPQPEAPELKATYDDLGEKFCSLPETVSSLAHSPVYMRRFRRFRRTNRLVEIGAAAGTFLARCRDEGWEVFGVELSASSSAFSRDERGLDVITGTIHEACFPGDYFDVVTAWQTIEHVSDPREVCAEAHRILRPGGLLVLSVPCWKGLTIRMIGKRYRYVGRHHLFYFSTSNMRKMLAGVGFSSIRTGTKGFNPIGALRDFRRRPSGGSEGDGVSWGGLEAKIRNHGILISCYRFYSEFVGFFGLGDTLYTEAIK